MNVSGQIFQIQNFSLHDGHGIRTVIFFSGCPLRCRWCANPEGMTREPSLAFYKNLCAGCGRCTAVCPDHLGIDWENPDIRKNCRSCGACASVCPTGARTLYGRRITPQELLDELEENLSVFRFSGGGVTLSGGEPTAQPDFFNQVCRLLYDTGIRLAMESSGAFDMPQVMEGLSRMDTIFTDIKCMDEERHIRYTGVSNHPILENIRAYAGLSARIIIRVPVIKGVNADEENIRETARFVRRHLPAARMELLPYHTLGKSKYQALSLTPPPDCFLTPDEEEMKRLRQLVLSEGVLMV